MRILLLAVATVLPVVALAQGAQSTASDSALIGRLLLAEDRRDPTDLAWSAASQHPDPRIRSMGFRGVQRIADPRYASRDSISPRVAVAQWPEPAWRLRFRALAAKDIGCPAVRVAMADSAWPVRLQALDVVPARCAEDDSVVATLSAWVDRVPDDASRRAAGGVSWHAAAHALVALARLRPDDARPRLSRVSSHRQWQLRMYAARAAAVLFDTATLRSLARDRDDNVKDAAITALSRLTGHADDALYLSAIGGSGAQAVRAAAIALKGSPLPEVAAAVTAAFNKWVERNVASAHDVRLALLEAAGRTVKDDHPPAVQVTLPERAVALALGADVQLRVRMSPFSGGGSFVVQLRGDVAPMMAARILELANKGYYRGLSWHRVEPDFVIQGGSPGASEYVGSAQLLRDELGNVPHVRGTVGMSTRGHDTGDAQWFVNLRDNLRLNRDYSVFGDVIVGIEIVDGILEGDVIEAIEEVRPPSR